MASTTTVSERITAAVLDSGHTQGRVARHLGLSRVAVNDRMRGRTRWSVDDVLGLSGLLGVHVADLLEERS